MLQNFITPDDPLNLDNIRATLIRLEDTIIFGILDLMFAAQEGDIDDPISTD